MPIRDPNLAFSQPLGGFARPLAKVEPFHRYLHGGWGETARHENPTPTWDRSPISATRNTPWYRKEAYQRAKARRLAREAGLTKPAE